MDLLILPNLEKKNAVSCTQRTVAILSGLGCRCLLDEALVTSILNTQAVFMPFHQALEYCSLIVAIGGDGTIIHAAKHAVEAGRPIVGINVGRLGYLAQIEPGQNHLLARLVSGDYRIQKRMLLHAAIQGPDGARELLGLNDLVINRGAVSHMLDIEIFCDGASIERLRADGVIFATPTGSTAYSLSSGGPIVDPEIDCIIKTPISPHSLISRPVLFAPHKKLVIRLQPPCDDSGPYISADGDTTLLLGDGDEIIIGRANQAVQFISFDEKSFYEVLSHKFAPYR